tara:strand:- start:4827 stop:5075 length:249 start_codon:yes stop_codon:yes gene_type:complete
MAKNVSGLNYELVYDNIPYHVKESVGLPLTSSGLTNDQIRFFLEFQNSISHIMYERFEEEKESIRQLAEEMNTVCNQILEDK